MTTDLFLFKDPRRRRRAIDHFQCLADVMAADIDALCGAAKEACRREHLAGVFYGYLQEIVWNNGFFGQRLADADVAHTAAARSGHAGLKKVLASPHVDFLSSPYSYGFRGVGGEGGFMSLQASVRRAGKLWFSEEDMRTHLGPPNSGLRPDRKTRTRPARCSSASSPMSSCIPRAAGGATGPRRSLAEPEVMDVFRRVAGDRTPRLEPARPLLGRRDRHRHRRRERVLPLDAQQLRHPQLAQPRLGHRRMGAPVDWLLLSDVLEGRARDYKFYFFMNAFHLSREGAGTTEGVTAAGRQSGAVDVRARVCGR